MCTKIRRPPAWGTIFTVDLLLEIVARSDVTAVVRSAATCRILRAAILAPSFRRLLLQAADDGGGFDPSGLLLGVTYLQYDSESRTTTHRVIHAPDPTRPRVRLDDGSIQQCFDPLAARDGLFLLRRHESSVPAPVKLRVCNTLTGHVTDIPPTAVSDKHPHILLSVGDGGSFELYVVDYRMRFQIFSSKDGTWGVVREAISVPQHPRHPSLPVVIGRTIYWLFQLNVVENYDMILALDTDAAETTTMELPDGCFSRMLQCKNDKHLLLASVRGRLSLLVTESRGIAIWTWTPAASSGLAATWNRRLVIGVTEMLRQAGLEDSYRLTCTPFNLEGFGERSGSVILSLALGQLFRLDIETKQAIVFRRLTSRGSVWVRHVFLHEIDLISLLRTMKIF